MTTISSKFDVQVEPQTPEQETTSTLTVEHLLYGFITAAAAILRLTNLGRLPLSPAEAQEALAIWHFWQPDGTFTAAVSPAYFSLTSLLTQFAGDSDTVMRLIPALAGVGLVLLPVWLRPVIGRPAALLSSFLLALSPTLTATARTAGGDALALLALLLLFTSWVYLRHDGQAIWLYPLAGAIGLGVTSAPLFYGGLVALAVAWGLDRFIGELEEEPQEDEDIEAEINVLTVEAEAVETAAVEEEPAATESISPIQRRAALIGLGVAIALATFFLWNPSGIGATAALFASWLGQFRFDVTVQQWLDPVLALGRYEAAVLILGTISAAWATWYGKNQIANLAAYWFIGGLILLLLQAGQLTNVLLLTLPGYLLIALFLHHLFSQSHKLTEGWTRWPLAFLIFILLGIMAKNLGRYARLQLFNPDDSSNLGLAVICALMGLIIIALVLVWDYRSALQGILIPVMIAFAILNWGQAWRLGHLAANDPRERWVREGTDDDIPLMVDTIEELARQNKGSAKSATIYSAIDHPAVRWYLRDFPQVEFGSTAPVGASYDFVLTAAEADPQFGSDYVGTDFGYHRPSVAHNLDADAALRWWFFYQSPQAIQDERAVLWLRTALLEQNNP